MDLKWPLQHLKIIKKITSHFNESHFIIFHEENSLYLIYFLNVLLNPEKKTEKDNVTLRVIEFKIDCIDFYGINTSTKIIIFS